MLSDIPASWPPAPGPNQPNTGHKTEQVTDFQGEYSILLSGLHESAWWTGIQVSTTYPAATFTCQLLLTGGQEEFCFGEWELQSRDWHPLTWPVPAALGERLMIRIRRVDSGAPLRHVTIRLGFHELPTLRSDDRYLFVDGDGEACMTWVGSQREISLSSGVGSPPQFERVYTVIPTMRRLLYGQPWNNETVFCLHSWDEVTSA